MRAEDLFEAMGALDERLIALSEEDSRRAKEEGSQGAHRTKHRNAGKKRKRAQIYRFAAVAMTTAAAVFILLTARDLIGGRRYSEKAAQSAEYSEADAAQDTLASGAEESDAEESDAEESGPDQGSGAPDEDNPAKTRAMKDMAPENAVGAAPESGTGSAPEDAAGPSEEAAESEVEKEAGNTRAASPAAEAAEEAAADDAGETAADDAGETAEDEGAAEDAAQEQGQDTGKTAVDLLGENKGDYVKLEYISAEDRAKGGERKVPEYTEERERALTAALEDGEKYPSMLVRKGAPVYYVYLTDSSGKEDIVTFYANRFVGISTIPAVVMKISDEAFDAVAEVFE